MPDKSSTSRIDRQLPRGKSLRSPRATPRLRRDGSGGSGGSTGAWQPSIESDVRAISGFRRCRCVLLSGIQSPVGLGPCSDSLTCKTTMLAQ